MKNPSYEQVCTGRTGHAESIQIDLIQKSYLIKKSLIFSGILMIRLLSTLNRQGNDIGTQYSSDGKGWVEREKDDEGITSFNHYLKLLKTFFRWLFNSYCNNKPDEDWETPTFLKIKAKKPLRDSPYDTSHCWELDDVLTIVEYEPELRNQAIITLLWDADGRNHEIVALRIRDIILNEQY